MDSYHLTHALRQLDAAADTIIVFDTEQLVKIDIGFFDVLFIL